VEVTLHSARVEVTLHNARVEATRHSARITLHSSEVFLFEFPRVFAARAFSGRLHLTRWE